MPPFPQFGEWALDIAGLDQDVVEQVNRTLNGDLSWMHEGNQGPVSAELGQSRQVLRRRIAGLQGSLPALTTVPRAAGGPALTQERHEGIRAHFEEQMLSIRAMRPTRPADIAPGYYQTAIPNETTYDLIVQESRPQSVHYGRGIRNRWPRARFQPSYRPAREIPLSCRDACRCAHLYYENAPHLLQGLLGDGLMQDYERDLRHRARRQALGETGHYSTASDRVLVEMRQARALAGLDVSAHDLEITRRILADPAGWGQIGSVMRRQGWVDEVLRERADYRLH